jgi:hypothetical protein
MEFKYTSKFSIKASFTKKDFLFGSLASKQNISQEVLKDLKQLLPDKQEIKENPDLIYTCFNAAVANLINLNGDGILTDTALSIARYFKNKPMNIEHNRGEVVGYITNFGFSTFGENKIITPDELKESKDPFNIALAAVVWKVVNPYFAEYLNSYASGDPYIYKDVSTSWEIGFNDYIIAVGSKNLNKAKFVTDKEAIARMDEYLTCNGGTGFTKNGEEIYRVIVGEARPLGCAFTSNPAAAVQGIALASDSPTKVKVEVELEIGESEEEGEEDGMETLKTEAPEMEGTETASEPEDEMEDEEDDESEAETSISWQNKPVYDMLPEDEKKLADSLIELSKEVGPLDKAEGIWVGYVNANNNDNAEMGIKCANCALRSGENSCAILSQIIEAGGNCRFAVIPQEYINKEAQASVDNIADAAKDKENKTLNKPFRLPSGSKKKFGVYVKNDKDNVVLVKFGDPNMEIRRDNPEARKNFRARHQCDTNPGPKWKARYWSCKFWSSKPVSALASQEDMFKLNPSLSEITEIEEEEDFFDDEIDNKISQENKVIVNANNIMKFKNINELYAHIDEASFKDGVTPQAIREFLAEQIKAADEQYTASVQEKEQKEQELAAAVAEAQASKDRLAQIETELAEIRANADKEAKQRIYDNRMNSLASKYELDDKVSKVVAKHIRDLDDEAYAAWLEEDGAVILAGREKNSESVVAKEEAAQDALKEAKASVETIPNAGQTQSQKEDKPKAWTLGKDIELK